MASNIDHFLFEPPTRQQRLASGRGAEPMCPNTVYVVLQRETDYSLEYPHQHDCSCVSVHDTLAAANQAVKNLYVDDDADLEDQEDQWDDLDGLRIQTDSTGAVRVIHVDALQESLAWAEKKSIQRICEDDDEEEKRGDDDEDEVKSTNKKRKVI